MEHIATRPKESSCALVSDRMDETPTPSAMMNGTVIGPVVTPPESKATARYSGLAITASKNTSPYRPISSHLRGILNRMRSMLSIRKMPTPTPTVTISTVVSIAGTLSASTVRSGSDTVIATPSSSATDRISARFRDFVSFAPICVPMGVIDTSLPTVNRPMPTISISEPSRNESIRSAFIGTNVRHIKPTIITMGSTDPAASLNFSKNTFLEVIRYSFLTAATSCTD